MWFEDHPAPNHSYSLRTESSKEAAATEGLDLEEPPELGPEVASFLRGSMGTSEDKDDWMPLEPTVTEFSQWVPWRADRCKTPSWWAELLAVPEVGDHKRLAREVWALFLAPAEDERTKNEGGQPPGPSSATMPLSAEVYATCQIHLCLQGH